MQIDLDSDIVYFVNDEHLSYFEYKAGDYFPDDKLFRLFIFVKGKIHSTGGNYYQLETQKEMLTKIMIDIL
jgi:hypothetical protein